MTDFPGGGNQSGPRSINLQSLDLSTLDRVGVWGAWLLGLFLLWLLVSWGQGFYADWLWFSGVGHEDVLLTQTVTRVALFVVAVLAFLAVAAPNLWYAARATGTSGAPAGLSVSQYGTVRKLMVRTAAAVLLILGLLLATGPAAEWETVLLFLNRVPFGETEPIFGLDFGFFIFTLPVLELLRLWLLSAVVGTALVVTGFYYLHGRIVGRLAFEGPLRKQIVLLGALLFLLIALGHWLGRYELLYAADGAVYGVGYTDDHVTLPGQTLLTLIALGVAGTLAAGALYFEGNRILAWPVVGWLVATLLIGTVAPELVQRLRVEPAELAREREYLANNIQYTRQAFGLDRLEARSHPALGTVDASTVANNQGTIQNVRLWDESPLLQSYNQIQFFRLYYDFLAVHTDRYRVGDELRQVMLATRELSAEKLPEEAQRWVNRRLQFTHGYGVAMSPVTEVQAGGRPTFFLSDVPPEGVIELDRPDIYYGLKSLNYIIANSGMQEFNYPGPDGPVYTRYQGQGGVQLSSWFRRLLYAWEFRDLNILISGEINADSRIQYRRTIPERFSTIAPFLMRDREAYSVVADGRVFWIQDAYTTTRRYPYSTSFEGRFNYIRNSVKAVVDAYDGSVDLYVFDPDDPLIQAYRSIFPDLFTPADEMPEHLRRHVRVPRDQFTVQTRMLLQYHMQDPVVFYNKEDQWSIPVQNSFNRSQTLEPYYIVARLPEEDTEEFLLIQPFTPNNRHNLVGWVAARSDGEHYGELVLFDFPVGRHVDGPSQVEARIDNDAVISEQFTLWGQVGSEVMRGNLLVIPLGDALLYAEPVFLRPETLDFPELRRIILADADEVVMHSTLDRSVDALVGERPAVAAPGEEATAEPAPAEGTLTSETVERLRGALRDAVESLQQALETLGELAPDTVP